MTRQDHNEMMTLMVFMSEHGEHDFNIVMMKSGTTMACISCEVGELAGERVSEDDARK